MSHWFFAPSLATLRSQVDAAFPNRDRRSDGTIGDDEHAARASQHNPDADGSVDAWDVTHGPYWGAAELDCRRLVDELVAARDPRLQRVIFERRIWDPHQGWRDYRGPSPHLEHAHVETTDKGQSDTTEWRLPMFGNPYPAGATGSILLELGMMAYISPPNGSGIWWTDWGQKRWVQTTEEIEQAKWQAGQLGGPAAAAAMEPRRIAQRAFDAIPVMPGTALPPA